MSAPWNVVCDIETRPCSAVSPSENAPKLVGRDVYGTDFSIYDAKPFPPPPCHEIVCIGRAVFEGYTPVSLKVVGALDEAQTEEDQLRSLFHYLAAANPRLITWGGRNFDLPVLMTRAMKYGLTCPWYFKDKFGPRYRFSDSGHFDIMDSIADFGGTRPSKMEHLAQMLGMPGKPEGVDGGSVEQMMKEGRLIDVKRYCLSDVLQESIIWLRYEVLRGVIDVETHNQAIRGLREIVRVEPEASLPEAFVRAFDWDCLLLAHKAVVVVVPEIVGPEVVDTVLAEEPASNSPEDLGARKRKPA